VWMECMAKASGATASHHHHRHRIFGESFSLGKRLQHLAFARVPSNCVRSRWSTNPFTVIYRFIQAGGLPAETHQGPLWAIDRARPPFVVGYQHRTPSSATSSSSLWASRLEQASKHEQQRQRQQ